MQISLGQVLNSSSLKAYWAEIMAGELFGDIDVDYATTVANSAFGRCRNNRCLLLRVISLCGSTIQWALHRRPENPLTF
jgi:hypothetical protein